MGIKAACGSCGKTYSVGDENAGKRFKCKACGGVIAVPGGAPVRPSAPKKICVVCGKDVSQSPRSKDTEGNYFCPGCYESARAEATAAADPFAGDGIDLLDAAAELARSPGIAIASPTAVASPPIAITPPPIPSPATARKPRSKSVAPSYSRGSYQGGGFSEQLAQQFEGWLGMLIMLIAYGGTVVGAIIQSVRLEQPKLLGIFAIGVAIYLIVWIPAALLGVTLAGKALKFEPTQPIYYWLLITFATPAAILQVASWTRDVQIIVIALCAALPLMYLVFCLFNRQGFINDLVSFIFAIVLALVASFGVSFIIGIILTVTGLNPLVPSKQPSFDSSTPRPFRAPSPSRRYSTVLHESR